MNPIPPEFSSVYRWTITSDDHEVEVKIPLPVSLNPKCIESRLSEDHLAISVTIPDAPPVLKGALYARAESLATTTQQDSLILTIVKAEPGQPWPVLIIGPHPETSEVDPGSLYVIWQYLQVDPETATSDTAIRSLSASAYLGFVPAMRVMYNRMSQSDPLEAQQLLYRASQVYRDAESTLLLAALLSQTEGMAAQAFKMFGVAAGQGALVAKSYLAKYLSPVGGLAFDVKDTRAALTLLCQVLEVQPDEPIACHEMAMILWNGAGIEKDEDRARRLQEVAVWRNPQTPPLSRVVVPAEGEVAVDADEEAKEEAEGQIVKIAIGTVIATVVIGGAVSLYKYFRSKE
jgi:hypothetical protein